jgi:hypothetical protein
MWRCQSPSKRVSRAQCTGHHDISWQSIGLVSTRRLSPTEAGASLGRRFVQGSMVWNRRGGHVKVVSPGWSKACRGRWNSVLLTRCCCPCLLTRCLCLCSWICWCCMVCIAVLPCFGASFWCPSFLLDVVWFSCMGFLINWAISSSMINVMQRCLS